MAPDDNAQPEIRIDTSHAVGPIIGNSGDATHYFGYIAKRVCTVVTLTSAEVTQSRQPSPTIVVPPTLQHFIHESDTKRG